mmetsp:Transcript_140084/g.349101  ORF Transcript_140084/g.349101 Transcript_140084/m.349101 type:complete len:255 (+) Transcript_140084:727-1491(+)
MHISAAATDQGRNDSFITRFKPKVNTSTNVPINSLSNLELKPDSAAVACGTAAATAASSRTSNSISPPETSETRSRLLSHCPTCNSRKSTPQEPKLWFSKRLLSSITSNVSWLLAPTKLKMKTLSLIQIGLALSLMEGVRYSVGPMRATMYGSVVSEAGMDGSLFKLYAASTRKWSEAFVPGSAPTPVALPPSNSRRRQSRKRRTAKQAPSSWTTTYSARHQPRRSPSSGAAPRRSRPMAVAGFSTAPEMWPAA